MSNFRSLWQKYKLSVGFMVIFSAIYVVAGCLWYLAPSDKYYHRDTFIDLVIWVLGWATVFLEYPPSIFVPGLAVAGGIAGLTTKYLLTLRSLNQIMRAIALLVLIGFNTLVGQFFYLMRILIW